MKKQLLIAIIFIISLVMIAVYFHCDTVDTVEEVGTTEGVSTTEEVSTTVATTTEAVSTTSAPTTSEVVTVANNYVNFKITGYDAYCTHCCGKSDGITASGTQAKAGRTVAMNRADMNRYGIKYGDSIYIKGIGERVVEDTGCKQVCIDVVCENHDACYKITGYYNVEVG